MSYNNKRDYTSDFKVGVDNAATSETSVQTGDIKVDPAKQKIINDVKSIKDGTFVDTVMVANKAIITGTLVGLGIGFFLSFKFGKPMLISSLIGGTLGFGATKLYTSFNK